MPKPPISSHTMLHHNKITRQSQNQYQVKRDKAYQQQIKLTATSKHPTIIELSTENEAKPSSVNIASVTKFLLFLNAANALTVCTAAEPTPTKKSSRGNPHSTRSNTNAISPSSTAKTQKAKAEDSHSNKLNESQNACVTEFKKERYSKRAGPYTYTLRCMGIMTDQGICKPITCNVDPNTIAQKPLSPPPPISSQHAIIGASTTLIGLGVFAYLFRNRVRNEAERIINRHLDAIG